MNLDDLVMISRFYGINEDFVLAGGGNTSYKDSKHLYVKASGTTLADIEEKDFVVMDRVKLRNMWDKKYNQNTEIREQEVLSDLMDAREKGEYEKRPSVETSLHDLFPQKFVVHTHPALVNGITCSQEGESTVKRLFGEKAIWVPAQNPGYILAAIVKQEIEGYTAEYDAVPQIIFLQNHGIFIAADTVEEIKEVTGYVMKTICSELIRKPDTSSVDFDREKAALIAPAVRMLLKEGEGSIVTFKTNAEIMMRVKNEKTFEPVSSAFSPDHIVYCRDKALFVPAFESPEEQYSVLEQKILDYKKQNGYLPKIVAVENLGIFAWGSNKKAADIAASVFMDAVKIAAYAESFGGYRFMEEPLIDFINKWEVETYRAKISLASGSKKRLHEKIAIVTGSAQGFGKGIADEMVKEGANVIIADLNEELALENARKICSQYGKGKALAVKTNIAEEESVENLVLDTVLNYGGLDILVSNAGVLKAGSLEEMDIKTFEFVTKINYTGYFICVKHVSRVMKIQHRFNNDYFMDIIQINSKSGLEGSNKNFAYAGGKFGGIGLTQSFALELIDYRIKVNAICPGNFFEGPLWSNPENGLFVQYLKTGKVPGAKTVEDVKRYYEGKVPMKRGCQVIDVTRAILYLVEQEYETGQAVPVTGGQVMLK